MGEVIQIRDYQTREEQAIKLNRLANNLPTIYQTEQEVETLAEMQLEGIKIISQATIPHYMAPDKDPA